MIAAGIDVGLRHIKIVIVNDKQIAASCMGVSGGERRPDAVKAIWNSALGLAGVAASDVSRIVATGQGKFDAGFADSKVVEPVADACAARFLSPGVTSVIDVGADQMRVIALGKESGVDEISFQQKCSAGLGVFLEYIARRLGLTIEELSSLPPDAHGGSAVNDGCPVFAELGALELLNRRVPVTQVAGAVIQAIAVRMNAIINDKVAPAADSTMLIGGVSKNAAIVHALKMRSGIDFIIPEQAEYAGALGAALLAYE